MITSLPSITLFSSTMIVGTLMTVSSTTWLTMWLGMELNFLSFMPLMMTQELNQQYQAAMKYFVIQMSASAIVIFSMILSTFYKESIINSLAITTLLMAALLMKLGLAPCHWWFPKIMSEVSWLTALILMTWQKIGPMIILLSLTKNLQNSTLTLVIILNSLIGGIGGLNQTNLRPLLAYSSINHMSWMLAANQPSYNISMLYLSIYVLTTTSLIYFIMMNYLDSMKALPMWKTNTSSSLNPLIILILSMAGFPPFLGFIPKMMALYALINEKMFFISTILIVGSIISMSYYLNIIFNLFIYALPAKKFFNNTTNMILTMAAVFPILIVASQTMYALTMFYKP